MINHRVFISFSEVQIYELSYIESINYEMTEWDILYVTVSDRNTVLYTIEE